MTTLYDRMGSREVCDVAFKAKAKQSIGNLSFEKDETVLFIDTAKTSSLEGEGTTVYSTGGMGNNKLIAWEGDQAVTFTVEDALLSKMSFALLTGATISEASTDNIIHFPMREEVDAIYNEGILTVDLTDVLGKETLCKTQKVFGYVLNEHGMICNKLGRGTFGEGNIITFKAPSDIKGDAYIQVEFNVIRNSKATNIEIEPGKFAGYYYVEAKTLYRQEATGTDVPALITIPKVKIQSKFSLSMNATGDPSTFTFTMDAFPDYTKFNRKKKILAGMTLLEELIDAEEEEDNIICNHKENFVSIEENGTPYVKDNVLNIPIKRYGDEVLTASAVENEINLDTTIKEDVIEVVLTSDVEPGDTVVTVVKGEKNTLNVTYTVKGTDLISVAKKGDVTVDANALSIPVSILKGETVVATATIEGKDDVDLIETVGDGVVTVALTNEVATGDKISVAVVGRYNTVNVDYTLQDGDAPTA